MMKAFEPVTLLVNPVVLFQDDIFMSAGYDLLTNILFMDGELDILGASFKIETNSLPKLLSYLHFHGCYEHPCRSRKWHINS